MDSVCDLLASRARGPAPNRVEGYGASFYLPGGPADQPAPSSQQPVQGPPPVDAEAFVRRVMENSQAVVNALIGYQYAGDPQAERTQKEYALTITEAQLGERLNRWLDYLRQATSGAHPTTLEAMINDFNALQSLETLVEIDTNIYMARGFVPPRNTEILNLLLKSRALSEALAAAIQSEAYRRGLATGIDLGRRTALSNIVEMTIQGIKTLIDYGAQKAKEIAPALGGLAIALAMLVAAAAYAGSRRR